MNEVYKAGAYLSVSEELIAEAAEFKAAFDRAMSATPEEAAARAAEAARERAEVRAGSVRVPLDLAGLLDTLNWSVEYAEHLVQPYCTCGDSRDGWDYCQHAYDEGVVGDGN